jgi:hypothetical protein
VTALHGLHTNIQTHFINSSESPNGYRIYNKSFNSICHQYTVKVNIIQFRNHYYVHITIRLK